MSGFGGTAAAFGTGQLGAILPMFTFESARNQRKAQDEITKKLSERQKSLLKQQEKAAAQAEKTERLTRERRTAQSAKRLAIGLAQGKTGTVKTSALGLHNSGDLARNKLGA